MAAPYAGGCQCGAVRYELQAEPLTMVACHCRECQKQSASAFGLSLIVPAEALDVTEGETKQWTRKVDSGRDNVANFCATCGSRLFHEVPGAPIVVLRAGSLDDPSWVRPVGHVWTRSAQPWVVLDPDAPAFETQPENGFAPLIESYAQQRAG